MCGIAGIINFDNSGVEKASIQNMMLKMKHRGPDDEGTFFQDNIGLGFVRLSIIDLSSLGHQPMVSSDGRYTIVFNGEIYNYLELREELMNEGCVFVSKTDTEVLLNAYIKWGEKCVERFNGMWAFAIYDQKEKKLFAARDRFGVKPFYYIQSENHFAFASEIPAILTICENQPEANKQVIFDYLTFNRTDQTQETFFKEIHKLQHGHKLKVIGKEVTLEKWYDLKKRVSAATGFSSPKEYKDLLTSAIELRLRSDVKVGVCLSGGLDSSSIVSLISSKHLSEDLSTFSAVYKKGQTGDESSYINEFRDRVKNMYYTTPTYESLISDLGSFISAQAEPMPTTSAYAEYKVMQLAKGKIGVLLNGQGADESLAGYHYFFGFYFKDLLMKLKLVKLINEMYCYLRNHKSLYGIKTFFYFLLPKNLKTKGRIAKKNFLLPNFAKQFSATNTIAGNLYSANTLKASFLDHFEFKLEHLLKWDDRNSMAHSIESRAPFLDYRLVEKTLATNNNWIIKKGVTKFILRESLKNILPERIRSRRDKIGYSTPEDEWFRQESWKQLIIELLGSQSFKSRNIVDPEKALKQYKKHLNKEINISKEIWKWINTEIWFRIFIDNTFTKNKQIAKNKSCKLGVWDSSVPGVAFDNEGVSNYAHLFKTLTSAYPREEKGKKEWEKLVVKIKESGKNKKYDCIIGVSGGTDSCYLLHLAKEFDLRPLAVNLDNGWSSEIAVSNIEKLTSKLKIDLKTYVINYEEVKDLLKSYMYAGLPWIDMPTDLAIKAILYKVAAQEGVKFVLRGNDFRTEGTQPKEWTYGDGKQLKAIHDRYGKVKLKTFPNYTITNLIYYAFFKGIKSIYPYYYLNYNKSKAQEFLKKNYDWNYYGGHHHENLFTKFAISYWLPKKFNIDKRKITYSALVLSGEMNRDEAIALLSQSPYDAEKIESTIEYVLKKLDLSTDEFEKIMLAENKIYSDYPSYDFLFQKFIRFSKPFLKLLFLHKPQSIYQAEMRDKK
jgi:asparagine synthase (glutamine-hydrolysing)